MKGLLFIGGAILGAVAGIAGTYFVLHKQYNERLEENVDSIMHMYEGRKESAENKESGEKEFVEDDDDVSEEAYNEAIENIRKVYENSSKWTRIITRDAYDEDEEGYEKIGLTYYDDDVLADDADKVINNVDEVVGKGFEQFFGSMDEDEPDTMYVRNDKFKCKYEINRDSRLYYYDIIGRRNKRGGDKADDEA